MIGIIPHALTYALICYVGVGAAVALAFLAFGIDRVHPAAHGGWSFRPLLIPGLALLWPYVLLRWRRGHRPPADALGQRRQRAAHTGIWIILAVVPPLILLGGFVLRQGGAVEAPALLLAPPTP